LNAQKLGISEQFQHHDWDTQGVYGPIEVNGLQVSLGHKTVDLVKENAANLAGFNGAQITIEAAQLPKSNSAILAARHPIIFKHWGAVA
jgi:hypothetical protein